MSSKPGRFIRELLHLKSHGTGKTMWELIRIAMQTIIGPVLYVVSDRANAEYKLVSSNIYRALLAQGMGQYWKQVNLDNVSLLSLSEIEANPVNAQKIMQQYESRQVVVSHDLLEAT